MGPGNIGSSKKKESKEEKKSVYGKSIFYFDQNGMISFKFYKNLQIDLNDF